MMAGLNMMKIDDVFITHWHGDHCLGIPGIVDTMGFEEREKPLTIYAPDAARIKKCFHINMVLVFPVFILLRQYGSLVSIPETSLSKVFAH